MNSLPVIVSFSYRYFAISSRTSLFSERSFLASSKHFLRSSLTSSSIMAAVSSEQLSLAVPSRYLLSTVSRLIRPNFSDIPYCVIISLAILVAFSISLEAPVVIVSNTISSAARPPRRVTSLAISSSLDMRYFSSSGTCIT